MIGEKKWCDWFHTQKRNKYFLIVPKEFYTDNFNLYGLKNKFENFRVLYSMIKGSIPRGTKEELLEEASRLYGLIHARFINSQQGLRCMLDKYNSDSFPKCPRVLCYGARCLPYGCSEVPNTSCLHMYCPCCGDVYKSDSKEFRDIDGVYFGPSWVHLFVNKYPSVAKARSKEIFVPKVFGFEICSSDDEDS